MQTQMECFITCQVLNRPPTKTIITRLTGQRVLGELFMKYKCFTRKIVLFNTFVQDRN